MVAVFLWFPFYKYHMTIKEPGLRVLGKMPRVNFVFFGDVVKELIKSATTSIVFRQHEHSRLFPTTQMSRCHGLCTPLQSVYHIGPNRQSVFPDLIKCFSDWV
jgi:hypothetical protein